jgi:hypothetical protein
MPIASYPIPCPMGPRPAWRDPQVTAIHATLTRMGNAPRRHAEEALRDSEERFRRIAGMTTGEWIREQGAGCRRAATSSATAPSRASSGRVRTKWSGTTIPISFPTNRDFTTMRPGRKYIWAQDKPGELWENWSAREIVDDRARHQNPFAISCSETTRGSTTGPYHSYTRTVNIRAASVILELVWVLQVNDCTRAEIVKGLQALFGLPNFKPMASDEIARGLIWFDAGMDFGDAVHLDIMTSAERG